MIQLHVERRGTGPVLVVLHGFTGSSGAMHVLTDQLVDRFTVLAPDLAGHGCSPAPHEAAQYSMEAATEQVVQAVAGHGPFGLVGYSMGGRLGLHLCAAHPELLRGAVLIGASPGLADRAARARRRQADEALAERIERLGVAAFVREWEALPLWDSQRHLPETVRVAQRSHRLANRPAGLANSLRGMGTGAQRSLWDELPAIAVPTLLVVGAADTAYQDVARGMVARMPAARLEILAAAGHAAHLEQPSAVAALVHDHLGGLR